MFTVGIKKLNEIIFQKLLFKRQKDKCGLKKTILKRPENS